MTNQLDEQAKSGPGEHFDVLIVGAGISGIGAAYHLQRDCPDLSFAVLDSHEAFGGTWLIHRYPGARSDSDLFTFGYGFKPWKGAPIATRAQILSYLGEVIEENNLKPKIRYRHTIRTAAWSEETKLWTLEVSRGDESTTARFTTRFLWMYAHHLTYMGPDSLTTNVSIQAMLMAVIGGARTFLGPIAGAALLLVLTLNLPAAETQGMVFGGILVAW